VISWLFPSSLVHTRKILKESIQKAVKKKLVFI
jgi:hypothetical protein